MVFVVVNVIVVGTVIVVGIVLVVMSVIVCSVVRVKVLVFVWHLPQPTSTTNGTATVDKAR